MATLANKTIYIGRESSENKLHVIVTNQGGNECKIARYGEPNYVNNTVSRCLKNADGTITAHCKIEIDNTENMRIKNLKDSNKTYVDGDQIIERAIDENALLELGRDRYNLQVAFILKIAKKMLGISVNASNEKPHTPNDNNSNKPASEVISIRHLKKVWNDYHDGILDLKKKNKRTQTNRMMLMMFGSGLGSMVCGLITSQQEFDPGVAAIFTALPSFIIGGSIFGLMSKDDSIEEEDRINNNFAKDYVCPNCGRHLGKIAYEHLPNQLTHCPKCRSEFEF